MLEVSGNFGLNRNLNKLLCLDLCDIFFSRPFLETTRYYVLEKNNSVRQKNKQTKNSGGQMKILCEVPFKKS